MEDVGGRTTSGIWNTWGFSRLSVPVRANWPARALTGGRHRPRSSAGVGKSLSGRGFVVCPVTLSYSTNWWPFEANARRTLRRPQVAQTLGLLEPVSWREVLGLGLKQGYRHGLAGGVNLGRCRSPRRSDERSARPKGGSRARRTTLYGPSIGSSGRRGSPLRRR